MPVQPRRVNKADLDRIYEINNSVQKYPWPKEALFSEFTQPVSQSWLIETSDHKVEITGYIFIRVSGGEAEVMTVGVAKESQRQGFARQLMEIAIGFLSPGSSILLEVSHTNEPAISLYKALGFTIFSVRKAYYPDGSDALCMKLNIANPQ